MIVVPDLLTAVPGASSPTAAARLRRAVAVALAAAAAVLGALPVLAATGWSAAGAAPGATAAPTGATVASGVVRAAPSDLLAAALASPWRLLELSLRPDGHRGAVLAARFEAPHGRPASPEELVASLAGPAVGDLAPVAIVATVRGTAVDLAGRVEVDTRRRDGAAVPVAALTGSISRSVAAAGGDVRGVRTLSLDDGDAAAAVAFDALPDAAVAALAALEDGVSAPARMTTLLVRRVEDVLAVELTLTPRGALAAVP